MAETRIWYDPLKVQGQGKFVGFARWPRSLPSELPKVPSDSVLVSICIDHISKSINAGEISDLKDYQQLRNSLGIMWALVDNRAEVLLYALEKNKKEGCLGSSSYPYSWPWNTICVDYEFYSATASPRLRQ